MNPSHIYSISELNEAVRDQLESHFFNIHVEGEISNLAKPASGHLYFTLKDNQASISCALFKGNRFRVKIPWQDIENGIKIHATGNVSLYAPRGQYQLIINSIEPTGMGDLEKQYRERLQKLQSEGLFDTARKKTLPTIVNTIGIITSKSGAAVHDAITTIKRRNPNINVIIYPTLVQGNGASEQIRAQLQVANRRNECDILLLIRGGGSLEDLWAFNDEMLARAIVNCQIPTISGVGHEIDFTICDFACDMRAATPTAAAELACPQLLGQLQQYQQQLNHIQQRFFQFIHQQKVRIDQFQYQIRHYNPERQLQLKMQKLDDLQGQLSQSIKQKCNTQQQQIYYLQQRLKSNAPNNMINSEQLKIRNLEKRLQSRLPTIFSDKQQQLQNICKNLANLSPLNVLSRGYSLTKDENNNIIHRAQDIAPKSKIRVQLQEGALDCIVTRRKLK